MTTNWSLGRTFSFAGQRIAYDLLGEGPPLVMVHGTPFSSYVWRDIARELARERQVVLFDLLGYGQSEMRAGQDVSLGVQNRVLAALARHLKLSRPDVIGHDFGGATLLRAHLLDGCDYNRMLLFDVVALAPWGSPFVQHVRHHEAAFAGTPDYVHRAILRAYLRGAVKRAMPDEELAPYLAPWVGEPGQSAFYRQIAQMDQRFTEEIENRFGEIRCPVALLWGEDDEWLPLARGRELARRLRVQLTEIPACGHLMQEDAPEAIVAAALRLLR
jgi:pimeloyl-ACP methyl ester carboxylesterase